jgi:hypothetical protein
MTPLRGAVALLGGCCSSYSLLTQAPSDDSMGGTEMQRIAGAFGVILLAVVMTCCTGAISPSASKTPGRFAVVQVAPAQAKEMVPIGSVKVDDTRSAFFILQNVGEYPIDNITLSVAEQDGSSNTVAGSINDFVVSPNQISSLTSSSISPIVNLIQIAINHGQIYGEVAQGNYINPSVADAIISISGTTTSDGSTYDVPVTIQASLTTLIDLAAWDLQYSTDSGNTWLSAGAPYVANPTQFQYDTETPGDAIPQRLVRIANLGNVPITIIAQEGNSFGDMATPTLPFTIPAKSGSAISYYYAASVSGTMYGDGFWITLDTGGVVFNNLTGTDARLYFNPGTSQVLYLVN